ncbi:MAG: hypothetical protein HY329_10740 [Chloroflexi bacterium]|nr:hypothetical protein [Chloroflexota bacterium]
MTTLDSQTGLAYFRRAPVLAFLASRVLVLAVGVGYVRATGTPLTVAALWPSLDNPYFAAWFHSDAVWYANIATHGYSYQAGAQSAVAFFPLYPLLSWLLSWPLGSVRLAGMVLSNLAFLGGLEVIYRLAARTNGEAVAARAVWLLGLFPFSYYFSVMYSEALFLLLGALALDLGQRGYRWPAALTGALAVTTRLSGVALAPALFAGRRRPGWNPRLLRQAALTAGTVGLGLLAFAGYLWLAFGTPLAFASNNVETWGHPWHAVELVPERLRALVALRLELTPYGRMMLLGIGLMVGALLVTAFGWRRLTADLLWFNVFVLLIPLVTQLSFASGRYTAVAFPTFVILATLPRRVCLALASVSGGGLAFFTWVYVSDGLVW